MEPHADERVYLRTRFFLVTDRRVATPAETFALGNVVSVALRLYRPHDRGLKLLAAVATVYGMSSFTVCPILDYNPTIVLWTLVLGGSFLVLAALLLAAAWKTRSRYRVVLTTAAGERVALDTATRDDAELFMAAVEDAIADRVPAA